MFNLHFWVLTEQFRDRMIFFKKGNFQGMAIRVSMHLYKDPRDNFFLKEAILGNVKKSTCGFYIALISTIK